MPLEALFGGTTTIALTEPSFGWCRLAFGPVTFDSISYVSDAPMQLLDLLTHAARGEAFAIELDREGKGFVVLTVTNNGAIVACDGERTAIDTFRSRQQAAEYGLAFARQLRESAAAWVRDFYGRDDADDEERLKATVAEYETKLRRELLDIAAFDVIEEVTLHQGDQTIIDGYLYDDGLEAEITLSASVATNLVNIEVEAASDDVELAQSVLDDQRDDDWRTPRLAPRPRTRTEQTTFDAEQLRELREEVTDIIAETDLEDADEETIGILKGNLADAFAEFSSWAGANDVSVEVSVIRR